MTKRAILSLSLLILMIFFLSSCAPEGETIRQYGFFFGLLHGFLFPFAVFAKVFGMSYDLYAQNNTGTWYWVGYLIGVFVLGGGSFYRRRK